jgi:sugar phosphate isomerase/epimerase
MKLAFTTLGCPDWTLEQAAEAGRRYGYEGIELRLLDGQLIGPDISAADRRRVPEVCRAAGLEVVCLDTSVRIALTEPAEQAAHIQDGLAMLELAAEWRAPMIRVFGKGSDGTPDEAAMGAAVECLGPLAERGAALGVGVALETHDIFAAGAVVRRVLDQVPGPGAGAIWDTLHPCRVGEPMDETMTLLGDRLLHVHIKDGARPPDNGPKWRLALLGQGDVPMPAILAALHARGYDGWLAVEWEKKWHPELDEPDVALPQHAEKLREYLAELG